MSDGIPLPKAEYSYTKHEMALNALLRCLVHAADLLEKAPRTMTDEYATSITRYLEREKGLIDEARLIVLREGIK